MFKTPPIPTWIAQIEHPDYRNIFSYRLGNKNLWGTETLLGDWSGKYLLVAKDFFPSSYIEEAIARGDPAPYRHSPAAPTNRNLLKTLKHFGVAPGAGQEARCDFLYISACFLLRNDGQKRGPLPDVEEVLRLSAPVVQFTMDNMPNLKTVILMGREAEKAVQIGGISSGIEQRGLQVCRVSHPSFAMSDEARFGEWEPMFGN